MPEKKGEEKYEIVAATKEETAKVQREIDEVLKRNGMEIVITNTVQVVKRVKVEEGVPSPAEFMPAEDAEGKKAPDA